MFSIFHQLPANNKTTIQVCMCNEWGKHVQEVGGQKIPDINLCLADDGRTNLSAFRFEQRDP
jgi:hypothetical protein